MSRVLTVPQLTIFQQGLGTLDADSLNSFLVAATNVAMLQSAGAALPYMQASIEGTTTPGDGGAGLFYWNASATAADDNGATTIAPTGVSVGRWIRLSGSSGGGAAGGDLTGTYPNPTIALNVVSNAKLAQMAAGTVKSNLTTGTANAADNTLAALTAALSPATPTTLGVIEQATNAMGLAGTDTFAAVTSAVLAYVLNAQLTSVSGAGSLCKAWAVFNGSGTLLAGFNVASVIKNGTGDFSIQFTNQMTDANYATFIQPARFSVSFASNSWSTGVDFQNTSAVRVQMGSSTTATPDDPDQASVLVFR